ncbi:PAS domain S-box protein [candidate division WOR-3 bacterium]|nr:PAS domain S-box protein [candidate division WOR-3 bacterium]
MSFRNSQGWTSVQTQLTLVLVAAAVLITVALVWSQSAETDRIDTRLAADAAEHGALLDRALELEGSSLATFAHEYACWDEMVRFVQTRNRAWARQRIDEALKTYRADAAWVFDAAGTPVYATRDPILEAGTGPLPPGLSVKQLFGRDHSCRFFIAGSDGPIEIHGTTIHPTGDPQRRTPGRGYFFVARSWNRQYLAELMRLTGTTMRIAQAVPDAKPSAEIVRQSGEITLTRPLPSSGGWPKETLVASVHPGWTAAALRSSRRTLLVQTGVALITILGLSLVLRSWVTRPLALLEYSLASGSARALKPLERNRTEFGQLALLVGRSFGHSAALVKEVAERKRTEQSLRESEEKYRLVVDNVSEAIIVAHDWKIVFANPSASKVFGHSQLLGADFNQFVHPADRWFVADGYRRRLAGEDIRDRFRFRIVRQLGEVRYLEASAVYIDWIGRPSTLSFLDDITERLAAEIALRESEERFRATFEQAAVGVAHVSLEGRFIRVNQRFCDIAGRTRDEMLASTFQEITHPDDLDADLAKVHDVLAGNIATYSMEKRYIRKDGSPVWVNLTVSLMREPDGRPRHFISVVEDVSARKRAEEKEQRLAREVERRKVELEQVIYAASHDLRTPLISVQGFVGELKLSLKDLLAELDRSDAPPEFRDRIAALTRSDIPESLRFIDASTTRMAELLSGLLRLSRLGRTEFRTEPLDMNRVVGGVVRSLEFTARAAGAEVVVADLPACVGDSMQVGQVFANLVENALKYRSPERAPVIRISGRSEDHSAVYCVEDNGSGIAPDMQQRVFTPFFRVDPKAGSGEGLGLAIVSRIVDRLGGRIWVESDLDKGSRFFVALPSG